MEKENTLQKLRDDIDQFKLETTMRNVRVEHNIDFRNIQNFVEVVSTAPTHIPVSVHEQVKMAPTPLNTGWKFPTTTGFTIQGNAANEWTNPTNAYADDTSYATAIDGVTTLKQSYGDFGFGIPTTATIVGIEIKTEGKISAGTGFVEFRYGYDRAGDTNGTNYVPASWWSTSDSVDTKGGPTNPLVFTTGTQMADGNFYFRVKAPGNNTGSTYSLDHVQVKVYYNAPGLYVFDYKAGVWHSVAVTA